MVFPYQRNDVQSEGNVQVPHIHVLIILKRLRFTSPEGRNRSGLLSFDTTLPSMQLGTRTLLMIIIICTMRKKKIYFAKIVSVDIVSQSISYTFALTSILEWSTHVCALTLECTLYTYYILYIYKTVVFINEEKTTAMQSMPNEFTARATAGVERERAKKQRSIDWNKVF